MTERTKPNPLDLAGSGRFLSGGHGDNLVSWHPWGAEAFDKAKRENKPVFLSIGFP